MFCIVISLKGRNGCQRNYNGQKILLTISNLHPSTMNARFFSYLGRFLFFKYLNKKFSKFLSINQIQNLYVALSGAPCQGIARPCILHARANTHAYSLCCGMIANEASWSAIDFSGRMMSDYEVQLVDEGNMSEFDVMFDGHKDSKPWTCLCFAF